MSQTFSKITANEIHGALLNGEEIALVDTREEGVFGAAHALRAVNIPLSLFELKILDLVPNKQARLILVDDEQARVERASRIALAAGYTDIASLSDFTTAWNAAGLEMFSGLNVPSKAFGEFIEHHYGTPHIEASDLNARMERGEEILILDSRPMDEYHAMNIPTAIDVPGGELVHRIQDLVSDETVPVVVNCAGRTRSIIGCQSLINAGLKNPVVALKNGTMGWYLAGLGLEKGASRTAAPPSHEASAWGCQAAARVSEQFQVQTVSWDQAQSWLADQTEDRGESKGRTTYLLDVRAPEEFAEGHTAGSRSAPGGQLVQATDRYVGVQNARLILVDDTETRARMAASWLVQMGWRDVFVLEGGLMAASGLVTQKDPGDWIRPTLPISQLRAEEIAALNPVILDCQLSTRRRKQHIAGSIWVLRGRVDLDALAAHAAGRPILITGPDPRLAALIAADLMAVETFKGAQIYVLEAGQDLKDLPGARVETGMGETVSPIEDLYYRPYDRDHGVEQAMHAYLNWEIALIEQFERDGTLKFPEFPHFPKSPQAL